MPRDVYRWVARYRDGSTFPEHDPLTGAARSFLAVDGRRVQVLELIAVAPGVAPVITVPIVPGERPVCFRRRVYTLRLTGEVVPGETVTVVGAEGPAGSRYLFLADDGTVTLVSSPEPSRPQSSP